METSTEAPKITTIRADKLRIALEYLDFLSQYMIGREQDGDLVMLTKLEAAFSRPYAAHRKFIIPFELGPITEPQMTCWKFYQQLLKQSRLLDMMNQNILMPDAQLNIEAVTRMISGWTHVDATDSIPGSLGLICAALFAFLEAVANDSIAESHLLKKAEAASEAAS